MRVFTEQSELFESHDIEVFTKLFILWHGSVCRFSALNSYFPVDNKGFGNQGKDCYGVEHNFG